MSEPDETMRKALEQIRAKLKMVPPAYRSPLIEDVDDIARRALREVSTPAKETE